jgi:hypothetical protein
MVWCGAVIRSAIEKEVLVVETTQCLRGAVELDAYEVHTTLVHPLSSRAAHALSARPMRRWRIPPPACSIRMLACDVPPSRVHRAGLLAPSSAPLATRATPQVGQRLVEIGVVSANDMTTEAAVTKIAHLCGRGLRGVALRHAMSENLRGELTTLRSNPRRSR